MPADPSPYDSVAYPSYCHEQTQPVRMAAIGSLYGMKPVPAGACRVLELGCGNGSNLIPLASHWPGSEFVGIDLAGQPVARGQRMAEELGLKNLRLIHDNIANLTAEAGAFDYIIAHGVYSWVPVPVREQILALCQHALSPQGIAFISYNTYPGFHLRQMLREMLQFHTRGLAQPEERIRQGLAFTQFLATTHVADDDYGRWLRGEAQKAVRHEDGHFFHDELAEINDAFYFLTFVQQAGPAGLQYLGEADFFEMFDTRHERPEGSALEQLGQNRVLQEQYLDFLTCRRFRQTLLCRQEVTLAAAPRAEEISHFSVAANGLSEPEHCDLHPGVKVSFKTGKGAGFTTDFPLGKAALRTLAAIAPAPMAFTALLAKAMGLLRETGLAEESTDIQTTRLTEFLLHLAKAGGVQFHTQAPAAALVPGERPRASDLARWQIQQGNCVTSAFHHMVKVEDEIGRCLLTMLDGTRPKGDLAALIWQWLEASKPGQFDGQKAVMMQTEIARDLKKNLAQLARMGLLIE